MNAPIQPPPHREGLLIEARAHLLGALDLLKGAHTDLCDGDVRAALIKMEVGQVTLAEARKHLPAEIPTRWLSK
jgi:hypothetical protein